MFDEITYQLHMLEVWWYLHRDSYWLYQYYTHYPFGVGIVMGLVVGYYAEPTLDFIERHAARRAMRRRLRKK